MRAVAELHTARMRCWRKSAPASAPSPPTTPKACRLSITLKTRFSRGYAPTPGSHAAGGQNGPDHRCDWVALSEEVELRGGSGAVGDERAALSPAARRL